MSFPTRCAIFIGLAGWLTIAAVASAAAAGSVPIISSDLVLVVEQGREIVTLRSPETDLINWDPAVVPIPSVPDATHVDYAGLATTKDGEPYLAVNARFFQSYNEFGFNEEGSTIGFGVYHYDRGAHAWSEILNQWDSGVNVGGINDIDSERVILQLYGYDYDTVFMKTTGWNVSDAAVWDTATNAVEWAPAWTYGYSYLAPFSHSYMQTHNRGVDAFVLVDGLLVGRAWQYDGAAWTSWTGPPAISDIARVWPVGADEQWFYGGFGNGHWLAHRVGSSVSYSDLPGMCGLAWDVNTVHQITAATTNETPFVLITRVGYAWLNSVGNWQCRWVRGFPWEAHFLVARGPNDVVFEGKMQGETDMRLYYDHGGVLDVIDPPAGYETYTMRTAFWTP